MSGCNAKRDTSRINTDCRKQGNSELSRYHRSQRKTRLLAVSVSTVAFVHYYFFCVYVCCYYCSGFRFLKGEMSAVITPPSSCSFAGNFVNKCAGHARAGDRRGERASSRSAGTRHTAESFFFFFFFFFFLKWCISASVFILSVRLSFSCFDGGSEYMTKWLSTRRDAARCFWLSRGCVALLLPLHVVTAGCWSLLSLVTNVWLLRLIRAAGFYLEGVCFEGGELRKRSEEKVSAEDNECLTCFLKPCWFANGAAGEEIAKKPRLKLCLLI